jgi:hypothetical protein
VNVSIAARAGLLQRRTFIGAVLVVAVVAPLAYWGWRSAQPREILLNCSVAEPRVASVASTGGVTFRPAARLESGFTISYSEEFSVGPFWTLAWNSSRPGLAAVFLYDAGVRAVGADPPSANEAGRVDFWWNPVAEPNKEPVADSPWSKTVDILRPGRFCVTLLETPGSASDWTVTITERP